MGTTELWVLWVPRSHTTSGVCACPRVTLCVWLSWHFRAPRLEAAQPTNSLPMTSCFLCRTRSLPGLERFCEFGHAFSDCVFLDTVKYWTVSDGAGCQSQAHLQSWSWPPRGMWCWSPSPSAGRKMEQSSKLTFKPSQKQVGQVAQNETPLPDVSGLPYLLFHSHL